MKLNDLDVMHLNTARPLPSFQYAPGWRGTMAALQARLEKAWVSFYAPPPRRPLPVL
jgi:hypothetical protein